MKSVNRINEACVLYIAARDVLGAVFSSAYKRITQKKADGKQQMWYVDDLRRFPRIEKVLPEIMWPFSGYINRWVKFLMFFGNQD